MLEPNNTHTHIVKRNKVLKMYLCVDLCNMVLKVDQMVSPL